MLHEIALKFGTDKATVHHYCDFYEKHFSALYDQPIRMLEIGVLEGASAYTWREYFQNAELHFIDHKSELKNKLPSNCHFHVVDCNNEQALLDFAKNNGDFDIILDDGAHTMKAQQLAFKHLFPIVKNGGMFIEEDLHTSQHVVGSIKYNGWNAEHTSSTLDMLRRLIDVNIVYDFKYVSSELIKTFVECVQSIDWYSCDNNEFINTCVVKKKCSDLC